MLKEFDGAIGDKIVSWLEKFENWFDEREKVEGTIEPETRINTAVHNTKQTIFLTLRKHQNDYGAFATWDDFAKHMNRYLRFEGDIFPKVHAPPLHRQFLTRELHLVPSIISIQTLRVSL